MAVGFFNDIQLRALLPNISSPTMPLVTVFFSTHVQSLLFMSPTVLQNHNLHSNILQFSVDVQNLQLRSWIFLVVTSWVGCLTDCFFNCMVFLLVGLRLLKTCLMVKNVVQRRQSFFDLFGIQTLLLQVCLQRVATVPAGVSGVWLNLPPAASL